MLTGRAPFDDVLVVPADMARLIVADNVVVCEAQVRLAGAWVAEAARAQHNARQTSHLLNLPASMAKHLKILGGL